MSIDLQIFTNEQLGEIKGIEKSKPNDYLGFFYILEWNGKVKIGCTARPYERIKQLKGVAKYGKIKPGRVAISQQHTNFRDNEQKLHNHFKQFRLEGTELFEISFDYATSNLPNNLLLLDESESMYQRSIEAVEAIKSYWSNSKAETYSTPNADPSALIQNSTEQSPAPEQLEIEASDPELINLRKAELLVKISEVDGLSRSAKAEALSSAYELITGSSFSQNALEDLFST